MPLLISDDRLLNSKHQKYLERHLAILPSKYQDNEANKLAIVTYALIGLNVLGVDTSEKYKSSKNWLSNHYREVDYGGSCLLAGFVPSTSINIDSIPSLSLINTLFGLWSLACLGQEENMYDEVDKERICRFVSHCQVESGSFVSSFDVTPLDGCHTSSIDPTDLRYTYAAIAILHLMGCRRSKDFEKYISLQSILANISDQACAQGGFGQYCEPHAGFTSCALSILHMLGDQWSILTPTFYETTVHWLLERQVSSQGSTTSMAEGNENYDLADHGGFQGRENKFADTCYCFWALNSLSILEDQCSARFDKHDLLFNYLLDTTQNNLIGGFAKNNEDDPDLYHTCLGLAALALRGGNFNGPLFLPKDISLSIS
ncbi:LADA_0E12002g1_1 [Lachancea dasiensis]|uniref:LADA_0E12002g1_1 n=1 Tax=Lachancea dasiensis TaxID=1072105 RepID=A0A1G4JEU1_9SACH|nr:LADA_0E12002g1_1 [Lachancea dasiensis]